MITFLPSFCAKPVLSAVFSVLATTVPAAWLGSPPGPLFSQAGPAPGGPSTLPELVLQYAPLAFMLVFFWFLFYRPERQRQLEAQRLRDGLKRNDHVVTAGGIYGVVSAVDRENDRVTIKIDETNNVKMDVTLASIGRVLGGPADPTKQPNTQD